MIAAAIAGGVVAYLALATRAAVIIGRAIHTADHPTGDCAISCGGCS